VRQEEEGEKLYHYMLRIYYNSKTHLKGRFCEHDVEPVGSVKGRENLLNIDRSVM
jgi:hypothetical protein